jgi:hypothetical protein
VIARQGFTGTRQFRQPLGPDPGPHAVQRLEGESRRGQIGVSGAAAVAVDRPRVITDSNGQASITSIWPGHYASRAVHVHMRVHTDVTLTDDSCTGGSIIHTGQLFFDATINTKVQALSPYSSLTPLAKDTELVAFGVCQYHPRLITLANINTLCAMSHQTSHLGVLVIRPEVEMQSALGLLALIKPDEVQPRQAIRLRADLATPHQRSGPQPNQEP